MRFTKRQAIKDCQEMWEEIHKSGLSKFAFFDSEAGAKWRGRFTSDCPLCEYRERARKEKDKRCEIRCPLYLQYNKTCFGLGYGGEYVSSKKWLEAIRGLKVIRRQTQELREKIAEFLFNEVDVRNAAFGLQWWCTSSKDRYYAYADQILLIIKEALPELAKEAGYVKLAKE